LQLHSGFEHADASDPNGATDPVTDGAGYVGSDAFMALSRGDLIAILGPSQAA